MQNFLKPLKPSGFFVPVSDEGWRLSGLNSDHGSQVGTQCRPYLCQVFAVSGKRLGDAKSQGENGDRIVGWGY